MEQKDIGREPTVHIHTLERFPVGPNLANSVLYKCACIPPNATFESKAWPCDRKDKWHLTFENKIENFPISLKLGSSFLISLHKIISQISFILLQKGYKHSLTSNLWFFQPQLGPLLVHLFYVGRNGVAELICGTELKRHIHLIKEYMFSSYMFFCNCLRIKFRVYYWASTCINAT